MTAVQMDPAWLFHLHENYPIAHAIGLLSLVAVAGLAFGRIKVVGVGLGSAGVLFAGIAAGQFTQPIEHAVLDYVKEFGLILFVYTIGLQLGPGFFAAFRENGIQLNTLGAGIAVLGAMLTVGLGGLLGLDPAGTLGMMAGATTNTASLGAIQQSLSAIPGMPETRLALPALGYAVAYPAAIAGIISTLLFLTRWFRVDIAEEAAMLRGGEEATAPDTVADATSTNFVAFFLGIAFGVALGTLPIPVPGLSQPVQLGLAGGPLIVGLIIGRYGRIGPIVASMPASVNHAFREYGIGLFFAAVGLAAGPTFFGAVFSGDGVRWLGASVIVTTVPLLIGGFMGRLVMKMNFAALGGLLAGSVTDPPALTFVATMARSDAPMVAYVTVYPVITVLRILIAQILVLALVG